MEAPSSGGDIPRRSSRGRRLLWVLALLLLLAITGATGVGVWVLLQKSDSAPASKDLPITSAPITSAPTTSAPSMESNLPSLEISTMRPLSLCQGDCDIDSECADGLVCFQRSENDAVPGCSGGLQDGSRTDYCVTKRQPTISIGENRPLGLCQGDCDSDIECQGSLICYQRDEGEEVPGCDGGQEDESRTDFCVKPGCRPEAAELRFAGIDSALSYEEGRLELTWFAPDLKEFDENACPRIEYEVFLVEGTFSFEEGFVELSDFHNSDMITAMSTNQLGLTISDLSSATAYTVLVIAKIGDTWISDNREGEEVLISKTSPIMKPGVRIVHLADLNIAAQNQGDSLMSFSGEASGNLEAGDFVFGQDEEGDDFFFMLGEEFIVGSDSAWSVGNATLLDIYDVLSLKISMDLSRPVSLLSGVG